MCRFGSASTFLLLSWSIYGLTLPFLELLPKMPWRSGDRDAKLMAVGDVNDNHCWYHGLLMCAGQIGIDCIGGPPITNGGRIYRAFEFRNPSGSLNFNVFSLCPHPTLVFVNMDIRIWPVNISMSFGHLSLFAKILGAIFLRPDRDAKCWSEGWLSA